MAEAKGGEDSVLAEAGDMAVAEEELRPEKMVGRASLLIVALLCLCLAPLALLNPLLFHTLAELFSIIIGAAVFLLVWNGRRYLQNNALVLLGVSYLFVGLLDLFHTLTYKGMGVLPYDSANIPTQLWLGARYLESCSLLAFGLLLGRRAPRPALSAALYAALAAALLAVILLTDFFPDAFVEGEGLTPFKKVSEYVICGILLIALFVLYIKRRRLDVGVFRLTAAAIACTVVAELFFTTYISVYGPSNVLGHYFKIFSFLLIYQAYINEALNRPQAVLFRGLMMHRDMLRASEERYRSIISTAGSIIILLDRNLRVVEWNPAAHALHGLGREEVLLADYVERFVPVHARAQVRSRLEAVLRDGPSQSLEFEVQALAGGTRLVLWNVNRTGSLKEDAAGLVAVGQDLTERRRAEERYQQVEQQLQEARKFKSIGALAAGVAHDFNNLLTIIGGNAELLRVQAQPTPMIDQCCSEIEDAVRRAAQHCQHMLAYAGKNLMSFERLDINALTRAAAQQLAPLPESLQLALTLGDSLPLVDGDREHLEQVLRGTLTNAVEALDDGPGVVRVTTDVKVVARDTLQAPWTGGPLPPGQYVRVSIHDNGNGISEDALPHIFDPFFSTKFVGRGLGLPAALGIIIRHKGTIRVKSAQGEGTEVVIYLPATAPTPETDATAAAQDGQ